MIIIYGLVAYLIFLRNKIKKEYKTNRRVSMFTQDQLDKLKQVDMDSVTLEELVDINDVVIDEKLSEMKRLESYLEQIKNPYLFRHGKFMIKVEFNENGESLETLLGELIRQAAEEALI